MGLFESKFICICEIMDFLLNGENLGMGCRWVKVGNRILEFLGYICE